MTIDISDNNPRIEYTVAAGGTQAVFSVPFDFFEQGDVSVYVDDTLKTIVTDYTLTGGDGASGTVTFNSAVSGEANVVISRHVSLERVTDFVAGQAINRAGLNTQLDTIVAQIADLDDKVDRTIHLSDSEIAPSMLLTNDRKGKVMAFNETSGDVEAGPTISAVQTVSAASSTILAVANNEANINTVALNNTNITNVAGITGHVTTVATNNASVVEVSNNIADVTSVANNMAEVLLADTNAATATTKAAEASASATAAAASETAAATSETNAATSETNASNSETAAETAETNAETAQAAAEAAQSAAETAEANAATSETNASNSETAAAASEAAASTSATAAAASYDSFDDRYLGAKTSTPTLDNDGDALITGALYFDTGSEGMKVYDGSSWQDGYATLSGALLSSGGTMTGDLILNADPTLALQAATKEYVDTIASAGIHYHDPVRVESPVDLPSAYDNGTAGVGATLTNSSTQAALVVDGVTLSADDRVLLYHQSNSAHNGIYKVTDVGSASTNWVLTRTSDADVYAPSDPNSFGEGDAFFVQEGTTGAGELYVMNTSGTITFGTTAISFTQISSAAVYTAGTGVTLNGTQINIGQAVGTSDSPTFAAISVTGNVDGRNVSADGTKLDGIEALADVTDTANVTAAGALMDSEVTNLAEIKAFASSDYATAAQGTLADSAVQPSDSPTFVTVNATTVDLGNWTLTESSGVLYFATGGVNKMKLDASGNITVTGDITAFGTI